MKGLWIFTALCFVIVLGSLFMPYTLHDSFGERNIQTTGFESYMALLPLPTLIVISLIVLVRRNLTTGIIGVILGFFLLAYMGLLAFDLTFSIPTDYDSPQNFRLSLGFYLSGFAVVAYCVLLLFNLIVAARDPQAKPGELENSDLLDNVF